MDESEKIEMKLNGLEQRIFELEEKLVSSKNSVQKLHLLLMNSYIPKLTDLNIYAKYIPHGKGDFAEGFHFRELPNTSQLLFLSYRFKNFNQSSLFLTELSRVNSSLENERLSAEEFFHSFTPLCPFLKDEAISLQLFTLSLKTLELSSFNKNSMPLIIKREDEYSLLKEREASLLPGDRLYFENIFSYNFKNDENKVLDSFKSHQNNLHKKEFSDTLLAQDKENKKALESTDLLSVSIEINPRKLFLKK